MGKAPPLPPRKIKKRKILCASDFSLDLGTLYQNILFEPLTLAACDWGWLLQSLEKPAPIEPAQAAIFPFYSAPFAAALLDPPWGKPGYETPERALQHVPLDTLLPGSGVVFLWLPRYHVPYAMDYMQSLGFDYAEYITFVRTGKSSKNHPQPIYANGLSHSNMCDARVNQTQSIIRYPFESSYTTVRLVESSSTLFIFKQNVKSGALNLQKGVDVMYDKRHHDDPTELCPPCYSRTIVSRQSPCCRFTQAGAVENLKSGTSIHSEIYKTVETIIPVGRFLEVWGPTTNNRKRWVSVVPQRIDGGDASGAT
ncbi:hypothetical protein XU18_1944 [Perkinsela sp. CCAP 1560/4]|nr:hypothetical protein XU18_1944 [Perkinsela sp. CCAP 1560/4]|eukprot:KNH07412.1 hypothetical protein XU18_1944 [Perkinsela sp. CCAP 1560/4]